MDNAGNGGGFETEKQDLDIMKKPEWVCPSIIVQYPGI